jgi:hypothetical protein
MEMGIQNFGVVIIFLCLNICFTLKNFWDKKFMMLLKPFHHAKHHFPSLFRVDLEVSGMAIGGKNILPMAFSSPLFKKEVSSGCLRL